VGRERTTWQIKRPVGNRVTRGESVLIYNCRKSGKPWTFAAILTVDQNRKGEEEDSANKQRTQAKPNLGKKVIAPDYVGSEKKGIRRG